MVIFSNSYNASSFWPNLKSLISENAGRAAGGKLVDATPEIELRYKTEIERVEKTFGATAGEDFTKFPVFKFSGKCVVSKQPLELLSLCVESLWIVFPMFALACVL